MNAPCGCTAFKECLNKQNSVECTFCVFVSTISFTFTSSLYFKLNKTCNDVKLMQNI